MTDSMVKPEANQTLSECAKAASKELVFSESARQAPDNAIT
jgi:hypothetical protein